MAGNKTQNGTAAIIIATPRDDCHEEYAWIPLGGHPLVRYAVETFVAVGGIGPVLLVTDEERSEDARHLIAMRRWRHVHLVVVSSLKRRQVIQTALAQLTPSTKTIIIHEGIRPFVTPTIIKHALQSVRETGAAAAAITVKDTIKRVNDQSEVIGTPERAHLRQLQTPQIFRRVLLEHAFDSVDPAIDPVDEAQLICMAGGNVMTFPGAHTNIDVVCHDDLVLAEALLASAMPPGGLVSR